MENISLFFLIYIAPLLVLLFGLVGNLLGLLVLIKRGKYLIKFGPCKIYFYLFVIDTVYLLQILISFSANLGYDITKLSKISCKIYNYFNYSLSTVSPMLLVYLGFDRFLTIKYPTKSVYMRKKSTQIYFSFLITVFNLIFYIPVAFYYEINELNSTQNKTLCDFTDLRAQLIVSLMDLFNRVLIPSALMFLSSNLLICLVFKLRTRILNNFNSNEIKSFYRDIRFALCSILMNLLYIGLNTPLAVVSFLPYNTSSFLITFYLFYLSYGINFYIILTTNFLYRSEAFKLFNLKRTKTIDYELEMDNTHLHQFRF